MKKKLAILGAGGKMGSRITANLKDEDSLEISYIEISAAGRERLKERFGVEATDSYDALQQVQAVIFAVPDVLIERVSRQVVPLLRAGITQPPSQSELHTHKLKCSLASSMMIQ